MILAIDTATRWMGLALLNTFTGTILWSSGQFSRQRQTVTCARAIADGLAEQNVAPADLTGIAVAIGPGSYTGLRIGLGVAKGLALANDAPILVVPTFEIWAAALPEFNFPLWLTAEAGRRRIIVAPHRWHEGEKRWRPAAKPEIMTWEAFLERPTETVVIAGEISADARDQLNDHPLTRPLPPADCVRRPAVLAQLGWARLKREETADPATITPNYLRRPQGS